MKTKLLIAFAIFILGVCLGLYFADRPQVDQSPATSTTTHTVITKPGPNGSATVETTIITKPCPPVVTTKAALSKYRLGLNYVHSFVPNVRDSFELTSAIRLADTPVFLQAGFNPLLRQVTLGLSIEF